MVVGDDGLGWISLDDPRVVQAVGVVALLVILFEGGLSTGPAELRRAALPGLVLATFPLTAGHPQGHAIFNVVFFVVLVSTALQGHHRRGCGQGAGLAEGRADHQPVDHARQR
jgi:NhaP-type Na+/H+ and K+/H+ antiporter